MPRWGAERRARPLHEVRDSIRSRPRPSRPYLRNGDRVRAASFRCGSGGAPVGAPPPFFFLEGRRFLAWFLVALSKARMRKGIARTNKHVIAGLDPAIHGASE